MNGRTPIHPSISIVNHRGHIPVGYIQGGQLPPEKAIGRGRLNTIRKHWATRGSPDVVMIVSGTKRYVFAPPAAWHEADATLRHVNRLNGHNPTLKVNGSADPAILERLNEIEARIMDRLDKLEALWT